VTPNDRSLSPTAGGRPAHSKPDDSSGDDESDTRPRRRRPIASVDTNQRLSSGVQKHGAEDRVVLKEHGSLATTVGTLTTASASSAMSKRKQARGGRTGVDASRFLLRDELDNLGGGTRMGGTLAPTSRPENGTRIVLSDRVYRVRQATVNDVATTVQNNSVYAFGVRKIWTSMCPDGIDVTFKLRAGRLRPPAWFTNTIVNGIWREEALRLYESLSLVGYAVVTYGLRTDVDEICPHVVDPADYKLEWRVDQNGVRYYTARPLASRIPLSPEISGETDTMFEAADVFVDRDPKPDGDIRSPARKCLGDVVFYEQMLKDYQVLDHGRANAPLVVENPSAWEGRVPPWAPGGHGLGAYTALQRKAGGGATTEDAVRSSIETSMAQYASAAAHSAATSKRAVTTAIADATMKARLTSIREVDESTGTVDSVTPDAMWQRAVITLPAGAHIGDLHVPDPPKDFGMLMRQMQALICTTLGVPPELLSGGGTGKSTVASSTTSHEHLRSTVLAWRNQIERILTKIYWRIYGEFHITNLAAAAAAEGVRLTPDDAVEAVRSLSIEFRFRANKLDYDNAKTMFDHGVITGEALARVAIDEYGLDPIDVRVPERPSMGQPQASTSSSGNGSGGDQSAVGAQDRLGEDDAQLGDINMEDTGAVGFVGHVRRPKPVKRIAL
jgi:hypothetical protein